MNVEDQPAWLIELLETYEWPKKLVWAKAYRQWWQTDSHATLTGLTLGVGVALFPLVRSIPCPIDDDGTAWMVHRCGEILTCGLIANMTRHTPRQVKAAVKDLVNCRTFVLRDGVIGITNFRHWQETPEAIKKQKQRDAKAAALGELLPAFREGQSESQALKLGTCPGTSPPTSPGQIRHRGQKTELN